MAALSLEERRFAHAAVARVVKADGSETTAGRRLLEVVARALHVDPEHACARNLAFPGERGGMPERMIHHDVMHAVNGYGTDPAGECELAGFYAGHCYATGVADAFAFIVIALATFQLELPVSPAVVVPARGAFDPDRVFAAFARGWCLRVDVMGPWDYWALMPMAIGDARAALGLP